MRKPCTRAESPNVIWAVYAEEVRLWPEVQQGSNVQLHCTQVAIQLTRVVFPEFVGGLCFHQEHIIDDHIEPLLSELLSLVHDGEPYFSRYTMSSPPQLAFERLDVQWLPEAEPERVVNLENKHQ